MSSCHIVGHLSVDHIVSSKDRTYSVYPQGAALGAALGSALVQSPEVHLIGSIGDDYPEYVLPTLSAAGINTSGIIRSSTKSLRFWFLEEDQNLVEYPFSNTVFTNYTPQVDDHAARSPDAVHICPLPLVDQIRISELYKAHGSYVYVDPQPRRYYDGECFETDLARLCSTADVMLVSREDFPEETAKPDQLADLLIDHGIGIAIIKRDVDGCLIYEAGQSRIQVSTNPKYELGGKVTGAGDSFAGALMAARLLGRNLEASAVFATKVSQWMIQYEGMLHLLDRLKDGSARDSLSRVGC